MRSSTSIILEEVQQGKKTDTKPTDLNISNIPLLEEVMKSPKNSGSQRNGESPREGLKRSPRLERTLHMPSPPREEEFKDAKKLKEHEDHVRRRSSGSFSIISVRKTSVDKIKLVPEEKSSDGADITAPPNTPEKKSDEKPENDNNISYKSALL